MATSHPYLRRATTSVLVAVGLISGAILLLGDRFGAAGGTLTQPVHVEARIAACVGDESMRLVNPDRERCRPDERELAEEHADLASAGLSLLAPPGPSGGPGPPGPAGPAGRPGADGVSGFEIVTAKVALGARETAAGEARCPPGKVALGGGVLPDPESARKAGTPEDRLEMVVSGPLLPAGGAGGYGWTATVRNMASTSLSVVVAAVCTTAR